MPGALRAFIKLRRSRTDERKRWPPPMCVSSAAAGGALALRFHSGRRGFQRKSGKDVVKMRQNLACFQSTHARAIEGSAREGKGRAWKVAAQFERSGAHLVGQVRLLDVALVLGHRGGCGVGVGVGDVGLGVCVQPVRRAQKVVDRVVTQPCHIPLRLDSNRSESSPRFARYHDTAVRSKKPNSVCLCVRKTTLTSVLLCALMVQISTSVRVTKKNRDDLEEP